MAEYKLILVNNSTQPGNLIIYQTLGQTQMPPSYTLAWFSKYAYPGTQLSFQWDPTDFDFVWSGTGEIAPGVVFQAAQVVPANLQNSNQITLAYDGTNHVFFFKDQQQGQQQGMFTILEDSSIPPNGAAVGIGMAGNATVAIQAQPNMNVQMTATGLKYWVTFGNIQEGEFFSAGQTVTPAEITFPPNVNSMTVTLNPDNTWSVYSNIMVSEESASENKEA